MDSPNGDANGPITNGQPIQSSLPHVPDVADQALQDQTHAAERALFEHMLGDVVWGDGYLSLLEEGWYWRDAAYIAWKAIPKEIRQPKTEEDLGNILGISAAGMRRRRQKNPAIEVRAAKLVAGRIYDHIGDVIQALIDSASDANYKAHPDRKLYLEMAGVYTPRQAIDLHADSGRSDDMSTMSEDELRRQARLAEGEEGE
jgi:hypothetical protein